METVGTRVLHTQKSTGKLRGRVPKSAVTSPYTGSNGTVSNFSAVRGCITLLYSPGRSIMLYGSSRGRGASQYFTVLNLPEVVGSHQLSDYTVSCGRQTELCWCLDSTY